MRGTRPAAPPHQLATGAAGQHEKEDFQLAVSSAAGVTGECTEMDGCNEKVDGHDEAVMRQDGDWFQHRTMHSCTSSVFGESESDSSRAS